MTTFFAINAFFWILIFFLFDGDSMPGVFARLISFCLALANAFQWLQSAGYIVKG